MKKMCFFIFVKSPYFDDLIKVPLENRDRILKIYFLALKMYLSKVLRFLHNPMMGCEDIEGNR